MFFFFLFLIMLLMLLLKFLLTSDLSLPSFLLLMPEIFLPAFYPRVFYDLCSGLAIRLLTAIEYTSDGDRDVSGDSATLTDG